MTAPQAASPTRHAGADQGDRGRVGRIAASIRAGGWLGITTVVVLFIGWFVITEDGLDLFRPTAIFPSPRRVLEMASFVGLDLVVRDVTATLFTALIGWLLGVGMGMALGLWMSASRTFYNLAQPVVEALRPLPYVAVVPFVILWFGFGPQSKVLLLVLATVTGVSVATLESVRNVPRIYIRAAQTMGASKRQIYRLVIVPAIIPHMMGPLRVATAGVFTLIVVAEIFGGPGIGWRVFEARRVFNTELMLLGIILFSVLGASSDWLVRRIMGRVTRWSERGT